MFHCPEPGWVKQYVAWGRLQRHIAAEKHTFKQKNQPVQDIVKQKWAGLFTKTDPVDHASIGVQLSAVQLIKKIGTIEKVSHQSQGASGREVSSW